LKTYSIAILIINFNSGSLLSRCLECVANQKIITGDVFVLDNGNEDPISDAYSKKFPSVQFHKSEKNIGFAAGNNFLLHKASDYEWIALVNPDAYLEPDWLQKMLSAVKNYPEYSFFASRLMQCRQEDVVDGDADILHVSGLAWRKNHGLSLHACATKAMEVFSPCAAAALYRRDTLVEAGGFDEDYFCYLEDVDLGFRLRLAGHRCLLVPDAVAHHVGSATTDGRHSDFVIYHGHRNLVWTYIKNMPGALFWLLLPLHIVLNLVSIVWFLLLGKGTVILRAKRDVIKGIPRMWKKRREIQKNRKASVGEIWKVLNKSALPRFLGQSKNY